MKKFKETLAKGTKNNRLLLVALLGISTTALTYLAGGTRYAWPQLNIAIIILSAYYWQTKGSLIVAVILGFVMGPFMPLNTQLGIAQSPMNWLFRLFIYLFIALNVGYVFKKNIETTKSIEEKSFINHFTGLGNANKLFSDIEPMLENNEEFCLIFIDAVNLEEISKYVGYNIVETIVGRGIEHLKDHFPEESLYSINQNKYIIVLKEYEEDEIIERMSKYLKFVSKSLVVEDYYFKLVVKMGILFNTGDLTDVHEVFNRARIAADQGKSYESGVYVCNRHFRREKELFNEVTGSLQKAIDQNEFYLVYQPIVSLRSNKIAHAEILIRWDRGKREPVGPGFFIPIAEQVGLIKHITTWIIKTLIQQKKDWKNKGIEIDTTVNVTSMEISDDAFREWVKNTIEENGIERASVGIELTERVISSDSKKISRVLSELRDKGYKILMDDFGTGYNSLMNAAQIPFDIIKIDKYFIDRLGETEVYIMLKHTIGFIHELGKTVIAEGVETKEQLLLLKELECDLIQGYYFSKPLTADDFFEYYSNFDIQSYL